MAEWWAGIIVGVLYTVAITITGAGLRPRPGQGPESTFGFLYRVLGGGLIAGFVAFAIFRWIL